MQSLPARDVKTRGVEKDLEGLGQQRPLVRRVLPEKGRTDAEGVRVGALDDQQPARSEHPARLGQHRSEHRRGQVFEEVESRDRSPGGIAERPQNLQHIALDNVETSPAERLR